MIGRILGCKLGSLNVIVTSCRFFSVGVSVLGARKSLSIVPYQGTFEETVGNARTEVETTFIYS